MAAPGTVWRLAEQERRVRLEKEAPMHRPRLTVTRLSLVAALLAATALLLVACGGEEKAATPAVTAPEATTGVEATPVQVKKVTFMAGFKPQANLPFVGVYVAQEKGFFKEQGLDVDIQHSDGSQHVQLLAAGKIQFATADAAQVLRRRAETGIPIVAIALIGQTGQQGWVSLADSGINDPADWVGKTVGFRNTMPPDFYAILKANGVDPNAVKTVNVGYQPPTLLLEGKVDVYPVFLSNEPDTIRRQGKEVTLFQAADYGVPTLGLTYISNEDFVASDPDTVERFLKASLRGIQYAIDNPEEAVQIVLQYAPQEDADHQRFMLDTEIGAAYSRMTTENGLGWQTEGQWQGLADTLLDFGALEKAVDVNEAFTNEFVERIYDNGQLIWP
jgi:ABC-type nitrate/sulfonate/bicarbonate transport system substrate-binding protein